MTSRSEVRCESRSCTFRGADACAPVVGLLGDVPRTLLATARFELGDLRSSDAFAALYWAVDALDPFGVEVNDESLTVRLHRHGPSAEVAAWMLVEELEALPNAALAWVEIVDADDPDDAIVITSEHDDATERQSLAA